MNRENTTQKYKCVCGVFYVKDSFMLWEYMRLAIQLRQSGIVNKVQVYITPKLFGGSGKTPVAAGLGIEHPEEAFLLSKPVINR